MVGGYNSSNTSHIVELCEQKFTTYFINSAREILSPQEIRHFNYESGESVRSSGWLPDSEEVKIVLTSGASCPDTLVDEVMLKILEYFPAAISVEELFDQMDIQV